MGSADMQVMTWYRVSGYTHVSESLVHKYSISFAWPRARQKTMFVNMMSFLHLCGWYRQIARRSEPGTWSTLWAWRVATAFSNTILQAYLYDSSRSSLDRVLASSIRV